MQDGYHKTVSEASQSVSHSLHHYRVVFPVVILAVTLYPTPDNTHCGAANLSKEAPVFARTVLRPICALVELWANIILFGQTIERRKGCLAPQVGVLRDLCDFLLEPAFKVVLTEFSWDIIPCYSPFHRKAVCHVLRKISSQALYPLYRWTVLALQSFPSRSRSLSKKP